MAATSPKHQKLIRYVERARKKVVNQRQRQKLLALIGEEDKPKDAKRADDSDSDIEDMSEGSASDQASDQEMHDDSVDESEPDSSEDEVEGTDALQSSA